MRNENIEMRRSNWAMLEKSWLNYKNKKWVGGGWEGLSKAEGGDLG